MSGEAQFLRPAKTQDDVADGRRQRSSRSRAAIVRAMLELIRDGDMSPSAARIADSAGVSLRTVFRHFDDMDTLYREMTAIVEAEVGPMMERPLEGATWRLRLESLLERRTDIFELIMPYRISGNLRRFTSAYLMEDYKRFVRTERSTLRSVLPTDVSSDVILFSALDLATGFQAWRRMRQDQKLTRRQAREVMAFMVERLLAGV